MDLPKILISFQEEQDEMNLADYCWNFIKSFMYRGKAKPRGKWDTTEDGYQVPKDLSPHSLLCCKYVSYYLCH